jgi:uncharacterized Zn-binding protein involved in type VI secretion
MAKASARKNDPHDCSKDNHSGGVITEGSPNITIEGSPAARVGDAASCENGGNNLIQEGSATVFFNGKSAARVEDALEHGGVITQGASNVFIGSGGGSVRIGDHGKVLIGGKGTVTIGE